MKKKISIIVAVLLVLSGSVLYLWQRSQNNPQTQEEAIRKALEYKSEGGCLAVMTPAIHKASGARHTFGSSCIPPGWVSER